MYERAITDPCRRFSAASPRPGLLTQAWRYSAVGAVNTVVGYTIIVGLHTAAGVGLIEANLSGYAVGLTISYLANRSWTFSAGNRGAGNILAFLVLVATGFLANIGLTAGLTSAGLTYPISQAAGFVLYSAIVFMGLRNVIFARQS
jgi:putative flippase GtrA